MIKDREYVCASASIFASDALLTPAQRLSRFTDAQSTDELKSSVKELFRLQCDGDADIYSLALCETVAKIKSSVPDFSVFAPLVLKYDCTNIKTAIKAAIRNIDPSGMLFDCGTVPINKITAMAESSSFKLLPKNMSEKAALALKTYNETGDALAIDLEIDRACFEDMYELAKKENNTLICDIISIRADAVNLLCALRTDRTALPPEAKAPLLKRALVKGGTMPTDILFTKEGLIASSDEIATRAVGFKNAPIVKDALMQDGFAKAEKTFDEAALLLCNSFRYKPFGPEVAVRALLIREAEIMNCRIIEAALGAGLDTESVKERLRVAYV